MLPPIFFFFLLISFMLKHDSKIEAFAQQGTNQRSDSLLFKSDAKTLQDQHHKGRESK